MPTLRDLLLLPALEKRPQLMSWFCEAWSSTDDRLPAPERAKRASAMLTRTAAANAASAGVQVVGTSIPATDLAKLARHLETTVFDEPIKPLEAPCTAETPVDVYPPRQCPLESKTTGPHNVQLVMHQRRPKREAAQRQAAEATLAASKDAIGSSGMPALTEEEAGFHKRRLMTLMHGTQQATFHTAKCSCGARATP